MDLIAQRLMFYPPVGRALRGGVRVRVQLVLGSGGTSGPESDMRTLTLVGGRQKDHAGAGGPNTARVYCDDPNAPF